eukprot:SAG22_NODE_433_length_10557_cov_6.586728_8_plen_46_part_00
MRFRCHSLLAAAQPPPGVGSTGHPGEGEGQQSGGASEPEPEPPLP